MHRQPDQRSCPDVKSETASTSIQSPAIEEPSTFKIRPETRVVPTGSGSTLTVIVSRSFKIQSLD